MYCPSTRLSRGQRYAIVAPPKYQTVEAAGKLVVVQCADRKSASTEMILGPLQRAWLVEVALQSNAKAEAQGRHDC